MAHRVTHPKTVTTVLARDGNPPTYAWWCYLCCDRGPYEHGIYSKALIAGWWHRKDKHPTRTNVFW